MAEHLDPEFERRLREESEMLYGEENSSSVAVGRPNLWPQHVIRLTAAEQAKLREEACRRDVTENELVREWVAAHLT